MSRLVSFVVGRLLVLACLPAAPLLAGELSKPSVLILGEAKVQQAKSGGGGKVTRPFEVAVSGSNWWITTYESPDKISDTNFHWQAFSIGDGLFAQCYYGPQVRKLFTTLKPLLAPVACPDQVTQFIWLALAAPPQLNHSNRVILPPIYNPSADLGTNPDLRRQCEVDYLDASRWWPQQVRFLGDGTINTYSNGTNGTRRYPAPFDKGFLEAKFEAVATTNWSGVEIPTRVIGEIYSPDYKGKPDPSHLNTNSLIEIIVTSIEPLDPSIVLPPPPPPGLPIFDARIPTTNNQRTGFRVEDGQWPSLEKSRAALEKGRQGRTRGGLPLP